MEHVTEAIEIAEHDLIQTRDALREARELVQTLEQDAKGIEIELVGLRSYAQRRGLTEATPAVTGLSSVGGATSGNIVAISPGITFETERHPELLLLSRNDAVATVMGMSPAPMDRSSIHQQCALGGRDDSLDDISLSLSGLKRIGRVEKLGRGLWRLAEDAAGTGS